MGEISDVTLLMMKYTLASQPKPKKPKIQSFYMNVSSHFLVKYFMFGVLLLFVLVFIYYGEKHHQQQSLRKFELHEETTSKILGRQIENRWLDLRVIEDQPLFAYSAYYDNRLETIDNLEGLSKGLLFSLIRIITILPVSYANTSVSCHYKYLDGLLKKTNSLKLHPIKEHPSSNSTVFIVTCPLFQEPSNNDVILPISITIANSEVFIDISYPETENDIINPSLLDNTVAICVGPENHYSNARQVVEFVELYQLLEAYKFYFYNQSVTQAVDEVFNLYKNDSTAEVMEWNVGEIKQGDHKLAAMNDCYYRASRQKHKYIAIVNFDEILMPLTNSSLLDFLRMQDDENVHSFQFESVFFFLALRRDYSIVPENSTQKYLYSQVQTQRTSNFFPHQKRFVVKSHQAVELHKHSVSIAMPGKIDFKIPTDDALAFHYEKFCSGRICNSHIIEDKTAQQYGNILWTNVDDVCRKLFEDGVCQTRQLFKH